MRQMIELSILVGVLLAASPVQAESGGVDADAGEKVDVPAATNAPAKEIKYQTTCPVMGGAIDKAQYVDHDGKRVYICCKGCEAPLKKDPAKYIKKLEDAGITVARLQTECPVMGGAIDKALYVDHDGKRIYVCCQGCIDAVKKSPAKYIEKLADKGEVPASVPEKPKHGDKKADDAHTDHKGQ